jgi:hypothetical protein
MAHLGDDKKKDADKGGDSYGGQYDCSSHMAAKTKTPKPAKDTKSPLGAMHGGK